MPTLPSPGRPGPFWRARRVAAGARSSQSSLPRQMIAAGGAPQVSDTAPVKKSRSLARNHHESRGLLLALILPPPLVEGDASRAQSFSSGVRCHHRNRRSASQSGSRTNGQARRRQVSRHFPPPAYRDQAQQPSLLEPTVEGTMAALLSEPGPAAQQATVEDQAERVAGRRIQEARQRQCNAEWEHYHEAKAEFCKLPVPRIGEARCSLDILGYEPSALCK